MSNTHASLRNKVVCITGSSRGIGEQIAYEMARVGARLVLTYHSDKSACDSVRDQCDKFGAASIIVVQLNVTDNQSIRQAVEHSVAKYGSIDILVNNAAVIVQKPLVERSSSEVEQELRTNLEGLIECTRQFLPHVSSTVITIGSTLSKVGKRNLTVYCASKYGVRGFSHALSKEYPHLNVYIVNPGLTATQMGGYEGMKPEKIGKIVTDVASGKYNIRSGSDVDVLNCVKGPKNYRRLRYLRVLKNCAKNLLDYSQR